jgi:3-deoxy-manno-octulosonate cytidylyltransferase (CMP-KDO synthetase)
MKTIGIIPARFASSRFPGKPLARLHGKTIIERVYEQASKAKSLDEVIVATDDQRILDHVYSFGGQVQMTSSLHQSGTDRCAEVVVDMEGVGIVVNIQGDEPFIAPDQIDLVTSSFSLNSEVSISTLAKKIDDIDAVHNPNTVKVTFSRQQKALYFSRSSIPHLRGVPKEDWLQKGTFYKHIGLYAYRADVLKELSQLSPSGYEQMESLEQLRWLQAGYAIHINITDQETIGIDTPEDLEKAKQLHK